MPPKTYPLFAVASEFLRVSSKSNKSLTPLQLMKLSYISFGWYAANHNKDMFSERIEAWRLGPVMPALYYETKHYGRNPVPYSSFFSISNEGIDEFGKGFIKSVYDQYGHFDGLYLSRLCHQEGSPWEQVYDPDIPWREIPKQIIYSYYKGKLDEYNSKMG
ncbi:MAG: DUF4065 domain-containing protein [Rhodobacteraceae bacterium]|nr:DUF4065 domain-containing protein [Paracoccaceae bacterium]